MARANLIGWDGPIFGGLTDVIGNDWVPESHSGVLNLLGNRLLPAEVPRGPVEAIGVGLEVQPGDLTFRCNFGVMDPITMRVIERRVCREIDTATSDALSRLIVEHQREDMPFSIDMAASRDYRCVARLRSKDGTPLSSAVSNTDPAYPVEGHEVFSDTGYDRIESIPLDESNAAFTTAAYVNQFVEHCERVLSLDDSKSVQVGQHMFASTVLTRGPGTAIPELPRLSDTLLSDVVMIAESHIERGIARMLGCGLTMVKEVDEGEFYQEALSLALAAVDRGQSVVIHLKGPDEFGHDGDLDGKTAVLERIGRHFLDPLVAQAVESHLVVVTSDHCTPCRAKRHTADPVPFVLCGQSVNFGNVRQLSERACSEGIRLNSGVDLFRIIQMTASYA